MAAEEEYPLGYEFGQKRPPLSVLIKSILDRYPDGQIFKEIIQNADDAKARTVRFYLDHRQHGTQSLVHRQLAAYQGPALLAFNDAQFEDNDWEGIQNLQMSNKAKDPFKVGKFGIGFNSVYHISDVPVIVSRDRMAFLDPQERLWEGKSGKYFKLTDVKHKADTVSPFHLLCNIAVEPNCSGTIFRFPLRQVESSLSNQCYNMAKIQLLLQALREEGKLLLLFLRSIESIEVHEIKVDGTVTLNFSVCISQDRRERVRQIRDTFMQNVEKAYKLSKYNIKDCIPMSVDFHVELNIEGSMTNHYWLVVNHVGCENHQVQQQAARQHVFPWVGVALELSKLAQVGKGRVFCFLPMPPDITSPFPVHINGTFGLNDDRRTIRWQGVERTNDPAAHWNNLIVSFLLPSCYKRLLMYCIKLHHLTHTDVYQCWPNVKQVNASNWKNFLQPFLNMYLEEESVVWAENLETSGEWIRLNDATVVPLGTELAPLIHTVLTNCGLKIVQAPANVHAGIQMSGFGIHNLTHCVARTAMKRFPASYTTLDHKKKLELLRYCLSDSQYGDLVGLHLVPLADNTFTHFLANRGSKMKQAIYICSEHFPKHLFLNADNVLVSLDDQNLMQDIQKLGASKQTQLQPLDFKTGVELIKQRSFPQDWHTKSTAEVIVLNHKEWYKTFWQWVQPYSLSYFNNDMVIPLSTPGLLGGLQVTRLVAHSPVLHLTNSDQCSAELMLFISKTAVLVSQTSTHPFLKHEELYTYVNKLTPEGLLNAIASGCRGKYNRLNNISLTESEAQHVCQYLGGLKSLPDQPQQINVLINLPIFTAINKSSLYSILKANQCSWNSETIILSDNCDISDDNLPQNIVFLSPLLHQRLLINKLSSHVKAPGMIEFVLNTVFVMVTQGAFSSASQLENIMVLILTLLPSWKMKWPKQMTEVTTTLSTLPFLPTALSCKSPSQLYNSGLCELVNTSALWTLPLLRTAPSRKSPSQLYDSGRPELVALFEGEQVFPLAPFNTEEMLVQLRQCGLMSYVTLHVLVGVVRSIGSLASSSNPQQVTQVQCNRAKAVIHYLTRLNPPEVQSFFKQLANISWIPLRSQPPSTPFDGYPQCLPWKGKSYSRHFVSLGSHVFVPTPATAEYPFILGSQVWVADCVLQMSKPESVLPSSSSYVPQVLAHFKEVITHSDEWEPTERLLHLIYDYLNANCSQFVVKTFKTFPSWIWLASERMFVSPSVVAMKPNPSFPQDLSPYLYTLRDRFGTQYQSLFMHCGVGSEVVSRQVATVLGMMSKVGTSMMTVDKAWQMVMSIFNWLTNNGEKQVEDFDDVQLYVPIESKEEHPVFKGISENVVYNDNDFLEGVLARSGQEYSYILINHRITPRMACCLGLDALSKHLDISEEMFEDVGQCEPLTVRLKNILRDYKDGLTIIKELIQNADDAEATEINICYDTRTHCEDQRSLFLPHMAGTHGPALVVHNNATFTDDDFQNITKLAGATKENKPLKIGKFGIGFCSVYHMTDVPSFVSREFLYIFDPTLQYVGDAVKNPSKPGKKLSFTHRIIKFSKQMDPFRGLYDFNPSQEYKGAIFRLPFRKSPSEISNTVYDNHTVMELLGNLEKHCSEMILFLHHIKRITFSRFDIGSEVQTVLANIEKQSLCTFPTTNTLMCKVTKMNSDGVVSSNTWLIATAERQITAKYATSSVACLLKECKEIYQVCSCEGESFCFLPLAKTTGLPVHISSNFAVSNNRRGIWTDDGSHGAPSLEAKWNVELMTSTIPEAYCLLLETLKGMDLKGQLSGYNFCALWPLTQKLNEKNPWFKSVDCIYNVITSKELFHSSVLKRWFTLRQSKFLSNSILSTSTSQQETEKYVFNILTQLAYSVIDLPLQYHTHLDLTNSMITEADFLRIFFNNIDSLRHMEDTRSAVLLKMLEIYSIEAGKARQNTIASFLKKYPCIPCTPDGIVLKKCSEMIDPQSVFATMYDSSEHMLPIAMFDENTLAKASMSALGLNRDFIPWKYIVERATGVQRYLRIDRNKALLRVDSILQSIMKNISSNPDGLNDESKSLAVIPFLPVKIKPTEYPLQWCGAGHDLGCGKELVLPGAEGKEVPVHRNELLSGSQVKILKDKSEMLTDNVIDMLQIKREPLCKDVLAQFKCLTHLADKELLQSKIVQNMCRSIYGYFEILIKRSIPSEMEALKNADCINCILVKDGFVSSEFVSQEWNLDGPYLFKVPDILIARKHFAAYAGIKQSFDPKTVFKALKRMKNDYDCKPVPDECQQAIRRMISILIDSVKEKPACSVVLPDISYTLHDACNLAYNDTPWCPYDEEKTIFIHENIPRHLAQTLGVKTVRSKRVERYASANQVHFLGVEFGQHEELTQRIQNIIRDYPFDETIIKELLQNADDAKAKTMYFILDKRTHKTDRILSENWKELQGPALLVWNDSVFSERDFEGIQRLGLGSKRWSADKIGQYGIGFNAVYHLTDCPSFISNGETLCILDPHCRYAPGADAHSPGRRLDHLSTGFWDDFPDMSPAYLHSDTQHFPESMQENLKIGSLFRFPIRHSQELVSLSKIIPKHDEKEQSSKPLEAKALHDLLNAWSPSVKKSMLFLNSINAITFCTVEQSGKCNILHHYETRIGTDGLQKCADLHERVHLFNSATINTSFTINYELEVLETIGKKERPKERWLIQQGIGDCMNEEQEWQYICRKPRHGIAFPLSSETEFKSFVFCFLPLPIESHLPVLINGNFILHSNRRELWSSTNSDFPDPESTWNKKLISAIASSYASLLTDGGKKVVQRCEGRTRKEVEADIEMYYKMFPDFYSDELKGLWKELAEKMYSILGAKNAAILANVREMKPALLLPVSNEQLCSIDVKWYRLKNDATQSEQAHFFNVGTNTKQSKESKHSHFYDTESIKLWPHLWNLFEAIGMVLTNAPLRIMDHFKHVGIGIPMTTPNVVFNYYASFNAQVLPCSDLKFPCCAEDTKFKSINNTKTFLKYLRIKKNEFYEYVKSPFGVPLLVTADGNIRVYDKRHKVIISKYSALFPHSLHRFLHLDMIDLKLSQDYFIHETSCVYNDIHDILSAALPIEMRQCRVEKCHDIIDVSKLKLYWECFCSDPVFLHCLPEIIQRWALLPASTDQLFSGKSELLPIIENYVPDADIQNAYKNVVSSLQLMRMPFLQSWACTAYLNTNSIKCCPLITNPSQILMCLQTLHNESCISFNQERTGHLKCLLEYFSKINFKTEEGCKNAIKSLPLYQTIDDTLVSVNNETTFLFPTNICRSGHGKWFVRNDVTFLNENGLWKTYLSPSDIDVKCIRPEEIYCKYIFPKFHLLSEDERYEQLLHIRDVMFKQCSFQAAGTPCTHSDDSRAAINFLGKLKALQCLCEGNASLKTIEEHCDHTLSLFTLFKKFFCFLPKMYRDETGCSDWLDFFRKNGLQTDLGRQQFLELCHEVADGHNSDTIAASKCLIDYLFHKVAYDSQKKKWGESMFLNEVASIPFVCMETLHHLSWIKPVCTPTKQIHQTIPSKILFMTELKGAFVNSESLPFLVWTIKPLVSLPCSRSDVAHLLGVKTMVQIDDIIQNIKRIAEGHLSDASHFDRLSENCKPPPEAKSLIEVMSKIFNDVQSKVNNDTINKDKLCILCSVPCIPVYRIFGNGTEQKDISILVKPCQVVTNMKENNFYPFLHQLPNALYGYMDVLESIGVQKETDAAHMRTVLEMAFQASKSKPLDVNTNKIVAAAIGRLYTILKEYKGKEQLRIKPLYLLDQQNRLCESTTLVYSDDLQYKGAVFNFSGTELSEVYIHLDSKSCLNFVNTVDFCSALPEMVRPTRLSSCTTMQIHSEPAETHSPLAIQLQTILRMHVAFKAIQTIVMHITHDEAVAKNCYDSAVAMASKIEVKTVQKLCYDVMATASKKTIGSITAKFAFDEKSCKLYIEPSAHVGGVLHDNIASRLSCWLMVHIESTLHNAIPEDGLKKLLTFLPVLLKVTNEEGVDEVLNETYRLKIGYDATELRSLDPRHGEAIPLNWHHRLDQDMHNIFTYREWVGFEKEDGRIVFAEVIHRISHDSDDPYKTKYMIRIAQEDINGIEAFALDLYKFLRGNSIPGIELSDSQEIVPRQVKEDDSTFNTAAPNHASAQPTPDLQEILKQLCMELKTIWQLPEEGRRKAVKCLYLKWHPDKNLHQVQLADQVFKFLKCQVDQLDRGLSLEDPMAQSTSDNSMPRSPQGNSKFWQAYYTHWEETVQNHHRSWHNEHKSHRRDKHCHGGRGNGGGGGVHNFWSQPTWHPTPSQEDGCKWLQQAEADMEVLQILYNAAETTRSACSYVCFLAYEVVCKALKGGLYFKCGLSSNDRVQRSTVLLANILEAEVQALKGRLVVHANVVKGYEESTRFPFLCQSEAIPARLFGYDQASEARKSALAVLCSMKEFMKL